MYFVSYHAGEQLLLTITWGWKYANFNDNLASNRNFANTFGELHQLVVNSLFGHICSNNLKHSGKLVPRLRVKITHTKDVLKWTEKFLPQQASSSAPDWRNEDQQNFVHI